MKKMSESTKPSKKISKNNEDKISGTCVNETFISNIPSTDTGASSQNSITNKKKVGVSPQVSRIARPCTPIKTEIRVGVSPQVSRIAQPCTPIKTEIRVGVSPQVSRIARPCTPIKTEISNSASPTTSVISNSESIRKKWIRPYSTSALRKSLKLKTSCQRTCSDSESEKKNVKIRTASAESTESCERSIPKDQPCSTICSGTNIVSDKTKIVKYKAIEELESDLNDDLVKSGINSKKAHFNDEPCSETTTEEKLVEIEKDMKNLFNETANQMNSDEKIHIQRKKYEINQEKYRTEKFVTERVVESQIPRKASKLPISNEPSSALAKKKKIQPIRETRTSSLRKKQMKGQKQNDSKKGNSSSSCSTSEKTETQSDVDEHEIEPLKIDSSDGEINPFKNLQIEHKTNAMPTEVHIETTELNVMKQIEIHKEDKLPVSINEDTIPQPIISMADGILEDFIYCPGDDLSLHVPSMPSIPNSLASKEGESSPYKYSSFPNYVYPPRGGGPETKSTATSCPPEGHNECPVSLPGTSGMNTSSFRQPLVSPGLLRNQTGQTSPLPQVDLTIRVPIPEKPCTSNWEVIKQLIEEETQDVTISQSVSTAIEEKIQRIKKKPQSSRLLDETLDHCLPEEDEDESDLNVSDRLLMKIYRQEKGYKEKNPKKGGADAIPVGEADLCEMSGCYHAIKHTARNASGPIPKGDMFAAIMMESSEYKPNEPQSCCIDRSDANLQGLDDETLPWDIDISSLDRYVGVKMNPAYIPSDESLKTTVNNLEYILEYDTPEHYTCVQLRGSQPPNWFPGYYSIFPHNPDFLCVDKSPSHILATAWNIFSPQSMLDNSEIILL